MYAFVIVSVRMFAQRRENKFIQLCTWVHACVLSQKHMERERERIKKKTGIDSKKGDKEKKAKEEEMKEKK